MDLDEESDIAIFQAYLPPNESEAPSTIDHSDLQVFHESVPQINQTFIPQYPLWIVGYSSGNKNSRKTDTWKESQGAEITKKLLDIQGIGEPMLFDYHLWKYREVLRILTEKVHNESDHVLSHVSEKSKNRSLPVFEDTFHNDQRALAVGAYVSMTSPQDQQLETSKRKTRKMFHNISGFHQISGAMICHFKNGKILNPKVIGLCKKLYLDPLASS